MLDARDPPLPKIPPPINLTEAKQNGPLPRIPNDSLGIGPFLASPTTTSGDIIPASPASPGREHKSSKKPNPLVDLIETERVYVDLLSGIIRVSTMFTTCSVIFIISAFHCIFKPSRK